MHPDVYIGITYLSRITRLEINGVFHEWMLTYIQSLRKNRRTYDWAQFISDPIYHAIEKKSRKFYMSSYIVYACAIKANIQVLNNVRLLGIEPSHNPVYVYFLRLEKNESMLYYKEVHDHFIMKLAHELEGRPDERVLEEVRKVLQCYGGSYIQFPKWSYLRAEGFSGEPFKLPKYPSVWAWLTEFYI